MEYFLSFLLFVEVVSSSFPSGGNMMPSAITENLTIF